MTIKQYRSMAEYYEDMVPKPEPEQWQLVDQNATYPFERYRVLCGRHECRVMHGPTAAPENLPWILVVRELGDDGEHLVGVQRPLWTADAEARGGRHGDLAPAVARAPDDRPAGRPAPAASAAAAAEPVGRAGLPHGAAPGRASVSPGRRGRAERPLAIRRVRRPPRPIALATPSQALYEVALSAVPSPAWRAAAPAAARADARAVYAGARPPGARGRPGHLPDQPAPSPPVAAPDRPLDRVCQLGGGGVTDAWFRAGSES